MTRNHTARRAVRKAEATDLKVDAAVGLDEDSLSGRAIRRFAEIGDQPPLVALSLGVIAIGLGSGNPRLRRTGFRMLTAHSLSTIAKLAGKDRVDRTRPGAQDEVAYRLAKGSSKDGRLRSMPSGHSAGTFAIASAVAADYPRAIVPLAAASAAVGSAQLPSRNHLLSDVVVGAAIGLVVAGLSRLLIPPLEPAEPAR